MSHLERLLFALLEEHPPTPTGERHALLEWFRILHHEAWPDLHSTPAPTSSPASPSTEPAEPCADETATPGSLSPP